jgi:endonuclease/exonuclease/phosphatase family metal-dependent hydrolase
MKKGVKIFIIVLVLILVAAAITAFLLFRYYPHYKSEKRTVQFTEVKELDEPIRVMSANLRCINPLDTGKKSWFYRADLVVENIENNKPSIIGFQEATKWQYAYLRDCLTDFDSVITYRDDSTFSEGCPIFYRTDMYDLVDKGSFWLSETPEVMSKDWNSKCYRICSYVILKEKSTQKEFVVFNTHLDHISDEARINGIGVVLDKIAQFGSLPSMIMGDFNAEEGSVTYENVTKDFLDARYQVDNAVDSCTYQNFGKALDRNRIDYFMISKTGINVKSYKVVTDTFDGVYSSDHFPLLAEFTLE